MNRDTGVRWHLLFRIKQKLSTRGTTLYFGAYQRIIEFCSTISHRFIIHVPHVIQSHKIFIRICKRPYKVDLKIGNASYTNFVECHVDSLSLSAGLFVVLKCIEIFPFISQNVPNL